MYSIVIASSRNVHVNVNVYARLIDWLIFSYGSSHHIWYSIFLILHGIPTIYSLFYTSIHIWNNYIQSNERTIGYDIGIPYVFREHTIYIYVETVLSFRYRYILSCLVLSCLVLSFRWSSIIHTSFVVVDSYDSIVVHSFNASRPIDRNRTMVRRHHRPPLSIAATGEMVIVTVMIVEVDDDATHLGFFFSLFLFACALVGNGWKMEGQNA